MCGWCPTDVHNVACVAWHPRCQPNLRVCDPCPAKFAVLHHPRAAKLPTRCIETCGCHNLAAVCCPNLYVCFAGTQLRQNVLQQCRHTSRLLIRQAFRCWLSACAGCCTSPLCHTSFWAPARDTSLRSSVKLWTAAHCHRVWCSRLMPSMHGCQIPVPELRGAATLHKSGASLSGRCNVGVQECHSLG